MVLVSKLLMHLGFQESCFPSVSRTFAATGRPVRAVALGLCSQCPGMKGPLPTKGQCWLCFLGICKVVTCTKGDLATILPLSPPSALTAATTCWTLTCGQCPLHWRPPRKFPSRPGSWLTVRRWTTWCALPTPAWLCPWPPLSSPAPQVGPCVSAPGVAAAWASGGTEAREGPGCPVQAQCVWSDPEPVSLEWWLFPQTSQVTL